MIGAQHQPSLIPCMPSFPGLKTQYECIANNISNLLLALTSWAWLKLLNLSIDSKKQNQMMLGMPT